MGVHVKVEMLAEPMQKARIAAAERAIAKAASMRSGHKGLASEILIAERRAEYWRELAKDMGMFGS